MLTPGEHQTIQAKILKKAERHRGFGLDGPPIECIKSRSLFFDDLLDSKVREFKPRYADHPGALLGRFHLFHPDIYGNRDFVEHLCNRRKFFDHEEDPERNLILIDNENPTRKVFEVTEEWVFRNGHYGTREDVIFLTNKIPVLVIEHKNDKGKAIALGVDRFAAATARPRSCSCLDSLVVIGCAPLKRPA